MPTGWISLATDYLRTTLSQSAKFQSFVGVATAVLALDHIYIDGFPAPSGGRWTLTQLQTAARPFALISVASQGYQSDPVAGAGPGQDRDRRMQFHVRLERDVAAIDEDDPDAIFFIIGDLWGGIIGDLEQLSGTGGLANIEHVQAPPWTRTHRNEETGVGDAVSIELILDVA